jgi:hypothetical protein
MSGEILHSALPEIESKLLLSVPGPISNVSQAENQLCNLKIYHMIILANIAVIFTF